LLLLLREPAVWEDLKLTSDQHASLVQMNEAIDGPLLASRNQPAQEQQEQVTRWLAETRRQLTSILDASQVRRLEQIRIRIRGYRSLLDDRVATQLALSNPQKGQVQQAFEDLQRDISQLQERAAAGEPREPLTQRATRLQQDVQKQIIELLSHEQRQKFAALVGRSFDVQKLAQVRFKVPELALTDQWINSSPLRMQDLRGKVVALHFWAYG
jgi:hypothetical protein